MHRDLETSGGDRRTANPFRDREHVVNIPAPDAILLAGFLHQGAEDFSSFLIDRGERGKELAGILGVAEVEEVPVALRKGDVVLIKAILGLTIAQANLRGEVLPNREAGLKVYESLAGQFENR